MSSIALNLETDTVLLPAAVLPEYSLVQALRQRHSSRTFSAQSLDLQTISNLLWSAFGVNRQDVGGRTAPSARGWQEVSIFAVLPEGSYRYDAHTHSLRLINAQDLRSGTGIQEFVGHSPLNLVFVADFAKMLDTPADERPFLAGADTGCIAQNVYLFCACAGLGTVVRALIDRRALAAALGLSATQRITLAQSVGHVPSMH